MRLSYLSLPFISAITIFRIMVTIIYYGDKSIFCVDTYMSIGTYGNGKLALNSPHLAEMCLAGEIK